MSYRNKASRWQYSRRPPLPLQNRDRQGAAERRSRSLKISRRQLRLLTRPVLFFALLCLALLCPSAQTAGRPRSIGYTREFEFQSQGLSRGMLCLLV